MSALGGLGYAIGLMLIITVGVLALAWVCDYGCKCPSWISGGSERGSTPLPTQLPPPQLPAPPPRGYPPQWYTPAYPSPAYPPQMYR